MRLTRPYVPRPEDEICFAYCVFLSIPFRAAIYQTHLTSVFNFLQNTKLKSIIITAS